MQITDNTFINRINRIRAKHETEWSRKQLQLDFEAFHWSSVVCWVDWPSSDGQQMHYFILNHVPVIWSINLQTKHWVSDNIHVWSINVEVHSFINHTCLCWYWVQITNTYVETTPSSGVQCPHSWALSPLCCYSLPLHIQSYKLQSYKLQSYKLHPNEVTMGHSGHMSAPCHVSGNISITRDTVHCWCMQPHEQCTFYIIKCEKIQ